MSDIKFIKDIGIIGLAQVLSNLGVFLLLPLITKTLGAYDYGIWAQISTTISLISPLVLLGLSMALVRFLAVESDIEQIREGFYSIFIFVLVLGILVSLALLILSNFLAETVFNDPNTSEYIKAGSFLVLLSSLEAISLFYFRVFRQIKTYALLTLFDSFGRLLLSFAFLIVGFGVYGLIGSTLIIQGGVIVISMSLIRSQIGFALPKFEQLRVFLKYSAPLTPNSLIFWITSSSDRYVLGLFLGLNAVGIYSAAYTIGNLMLLFITPIQLILFPEISKLYDENKIDSVKTCLSTSMQYFLLVAIPAVVGISILAVPILELCTTPEFVSGSIVIPFIALAGLFGGVFQIVINITHLFKKTQFNLLIHVLAAITNLILNFLLIPFIGILGAAIASLLSYILMVIIGIHISFKDLSFDISYSFIFKSVISSIFLAGTLFFINPHTLISLIISMVIGVIIYFLSMIMMKGFGKTEIELIKELIGI